MSMAPVICFLLILLGSFFAYFWSPRFREFIKNHALLMDMLSFLAALSVFISFYYTLSQYRYEQSTQRLQETREFTSRINTLQGELKHNLETANLILRDKDSHIAAVTSPSATYLVACLEDILKRGDITDPELRTNLFEIYHRIIQANDILHYSMELLYLQVLFPGDGQTQQRTDTRLKQQMIQLVSFSESLKHDIPLVLDALSSCTASNTSNTTKPKKK